MENIFQAVALNLATIAVLSIAIGLVLIIRAILKFSAKKGIGFFKAIPAYFIEKKARKANKIEDDLIEEGLRADRIRQAKLSGYEGTTDLKLFNARKRTKQLSKQSKKEKKLKK
ncbi:hypothetical protein, partial [Mycobacterium sp.]|uniref:hypothetical protein n=1 Tax=Mycobacterium sp. TaxID=1785 RepID=UPI003A8744E9